MTWYMQRILLAKLEGFLCIYLELSFCTASFQNSSLITCTYSPESLDADSRVVGENFQISCFSALHNEYLVFVLDSTAHTVLTDQVYKQL